MKEKENRTKFTKEFKADAINLVLEQGYSCSEVGRRIGIHSSNISRWVREFRHDQEDIAEGGVTKHELEEENRRLRKYKIVKCCLTECPFLVYHYTLCKGMGSTGFGAKLIPEICWSDLQF